ncbi:DUF2624 domain-containing protein [Salinibacillus xinjiangensis]|uniref:DUF2624 family protein n=1 Tax=Salinibacillus xinjiangensis TaxID=1229268 RepID=A0A6G1X6P8_9BACI|nr:DUF2624 domain-containing protein [Salinibacillus xinjiangensis]MRG86612.1 DUF2624 family protein [Salinibacillus xinjiangensis]
MKKMIRQMVRDKFASLTTKDLIKHGKQYNFHLTHDQADKILAYVRKNSLDPFSERDRFKLLKKIAQVTDEKTAQKANKLFQNMVQSYGIDHLFK